MTLNNLQTNKATDASNVGLLLTAHKVKMGVAPKGRQELLAFPTSELIYFQSKATEGQVARSPLPTDIKLSPSRQINPQIYGLIGEDVIKT